MALVLQDVYLFPRDFLSNLAPDGVCDDRETEQRLVAAARVVGADRFIGQLAEGEGARGRREARSEQA